IVGGSGGAVIGIVTHDPSPSSGGSPAVSEPSHASAFESEAPAGRPAASDPRASPVPSVAGVGEESTLAIQARLLGDAWAALERDDLEGALAKLRSHQDAFPQSPLAED